MRRRALTIACIGGGPAGLYFALLAKQANPAHRIVVYERNRPHDTFGFGVVFSEHTMGFLSGQDRRHYPEIMARSVRWDSITVIRDGRTLRCGGVGFAAVERKQLLEVLHGQASGLGVTLRFETEIPALPPLADADLIVASDGVNSTTRAALADRLGTAVTVGPTRFSWLGTSKAFDGLTFVFAENAHGVFGAHVYPYGPSRSTFIVETDVATWERAGMMTFSERDTLDYCERLFARYLDGHPLLANRSLWLPFRTVSNRRWHHDNVVLIGDAAHTAHFSVGSGTRMALEDAVALSQALARVEQLEPALAAYEEARRPRVEHIQRMAATSFEWWATLGDHVSLPPERFAFHFLTRSQFRYDTLRDRDPAFLATVERASAAGDLRARAIACAAPAEDARDGVPGPAEEAGLLELARASGHAVLTAPVAVLADGRVTPGDPGLYDDGHAAAWQRIVTRVHQLGARIGVRLGHAGPRGAAQHRTRGLDQPLAQGGWPLVAASPCSYAPEGAVPRELEPAAMPGVCAAFASAARRAAEAGFDLLQLEFSHGYLAASFISPLTNLRGDDYGGGLTSRLRFPLEVLDAVRATWPEARPLLVAFSATDWEPGGLTITDAVAAARSFHEHGAGVITVQGGHATWRSRPPYGRCYQMLIAGRIRREAGVTVAAAGGITDEDDLKTIILSGRADLCLLDSARGLP